MTRRTLAGLIALGLLALPAWARDPGNTETRAGGNHSSTGRDTTPDGFVPERLDPSELHPPTHVESPQPPLYQRVESDIDRGNGRIEDEHTLQLRRLQEDRDFPPGHLPRVDIQRERQRFQEDRDRRERLDHRDAQASQAARQAEARDAAAEAADRARRVEPSPQPMGSVLTRYVAQQSKLLEDARQKYQSDLTAAEAARDEATRTAPTREARVLAEQRFDQRRSDLTRAYQESRKKMLGTD